MSRREKELQTLQDAFAAAAEGGETPSDRLVEDVWSAVQGKLSSEQARALLDQIVEDPARAGPWLIARRILDEPAEAQPVVSEPVPAPAWTWRRPALGAAMVVVLVAGALGAWLALRGPGEQVYRGAADSPRSLLPEHTSMPRDRVLLRWQAAGEGTRYHLRVLGEDYALLFAVDDLGEPRAAVPEEALASVPDGGTVLWQVESVSPSGERMLSPPSSLEIVGARKEPAGEGNRGPERQ